MKTITMLMIALLVFTVMPLVAAEDTELEVTDAGITPDSPLYGLERAMERIQLAFIRNKADRAQYKFDLAEERLAEAEVMFEENNTEAAEEAQELHDELINETEQEIEDLESNGDNETAGEALDEIENLQLRLLNHSAKVAFVKNRILERLSQSGNVSDEQIAHLTEVFGKIIAKAQYMELKIEQKRENIRTKYKVLSELNESELTDREKEFLEKKQEQEQKKQEFEYEYESKFDGDKFKFKYKAGDDEDEFELEYENETEDSEDDSNGSGRSSSVRR
jgi:hypothetical protein